MKGRKKKNILSGLPTSSDPSGFTTSYHHLTLPSPKSSSLLQESGERMAKEQELPYIEYVLLPSNHDLH